MRQPVYLNSNPPEVSEVASSQPSPLVSVHDLGADYTRYFNPFSDSKRGSLADSNGSRPRSTASMPGTGSSPFNTPRASTMNLDINRDPEKTVLLMDNRLASPYSEKANDMFPSVDEPEDDDDMHVPLPDDDIRFKVKFREHFNRENIISTLGMMFMMLGLLFVFVALPIMSSQGIITYNSGQTPLDQMGYGNPQRELWAIVNNNTYPLLKNVRTSLIDKSTPKHAMTRKGINGETLELVFSDEFNDNNRTFYEGDDPYWYAPDIWYGATQDLVRESLPVASVVGSLSTGLVRPRRGHHVGRDVRGAYKQFIFLEQS
jgi:hypothetical protein